jgi:subtilisin family serine protease
MSACSNTNQIGGVTYYWDSNYKQANIGGTSMAAPQVAGIAALILQTSPNATPQQVKETLLNVASSSLYSTGLDNDWTDDRSVKGGNTKIVYNKYNVDGGGKFTGFSDVNTILSATKGDSNILIKN